MFYVHLALLSVNYPVLAIFYFKHVKCMLNTVKSV